MNIQFILKSLITTENHHHLPKKSFTTTPVPISHNHQPPEADFEAIYLEQAQLKGVGGEQWLSTTDYSAIWFLFISTLPLRI